MEQDRAPEHESPEDEGIPDIGRPHPSKRGTGDPQEGLVVPGEEPRAAEDTGVTAEEQREGAPLDERLGEEQADRESGERPDADRLVDESASGLEDREKEEVADEAEGDRDGRTAEEAAVRVEDEPGGLTAGPDRYVEEDEEAGSKGR